MRHLLVTNDYPPKVGGIQSYLWELYRRLPSDEVAVFTTPFEGADDFDRDNAGAAIDVERHSRFWLSPTPDVRRRIDAAVARVQADFVMIDPAFPLGALGSRLSVPYGLFIHGAEAAIPTRLPGVRQGYRSIMEGAIGTVSSSMWASAVTTDALDLPNDHHYLPPGVDHHRFVPLGSVQRREARARWGLDPNAPVIVTLSRLVPRKGMDRLVEATAQLVQRWPNLRLLIAGTGRDHDRLQKLIDTTGAPAKLVGFVADEDAPALYGMADVFAMPCRNRWRGLEQEGFGIVFGEAAAAGVAAVGGDSGGASEAIAHGETGLVVEVPDDPVQVAEALEQLLADPSRRADMAIAARDRAVAEFSWDGLAERYRSMLTQMASEIAQR